MDAFTKVPFKGRPTPSKRSDSRPGSMSSPPISYDPIGGGPYSNPAALK